ncbi:hypothetical protein AVEN_34095-1, partial [Araneus ventricosus]
MLSSQYYCSTNSRESKLTETGLKRYLSTKQYSSSLPMAFDFSRLDPSDSKGLSSDFPSNSCYPFLDCPTNSGASSPVFLETS